jgi:two-component system chemotaxis sensor kinase CheA
LKRLICAIWSLFFAIKSLFLRITNTRHEGDSMNLDEALTTFVIESRELLELMEDALLRIENAADDPEIINAIFRAAHTIKGSAGLFGLEYIVAFTHVAESVLDKVRSGEVHIESELVALLLASRDHIGELVNHAEAASEPDAETDKRSRELSAQLHTFLGVKKSAATGGGMPTVQEVKLEREGGGERVETDNWHISLRFGFDSCMTVGKNSSTVASPETTMTLLPR